MYYRAPKDETDSVSIRFNYFVPELVTTKSGRKLASGYKIVQYDLQDMSPYGHSLVWSSEGDRFTKMWKKRNSRKTLARRSR